MRNLKECQAEVFRRSEKRIKKRRQRRTRILMACIPLALCVTIFWAFILPGMLPAETGSTDMPEAFEEPKFNGALNDAAGGVYDGDAGEHTHQTALTPQTVEAPVSGYCGNTQTTLYIGGKAYTFMYGHSVTLTDLLVNLDYDPGKVCGCMPQYNADTEFGSGYQIHLEYGFVRCDKGQADLTKEQIDTIARIVEWAETTNCKY